MSRKRSAALKQRRVELARSTAASRPGELLRAIGKSVREGGSVAGSRFYDEAYENGTNLSGYLEELDPTRDHGNTRLDAFQRLVAVTGVRSASSPFSGFSADPLDALENLEEEQGGQDAGRVLLAEFISRAWRRGVHSVHHAIQDANRAVYLTSDSAPGTQVNPFAYAAGPRYTQISPAIPLSELVAINTGINANVYKAFYLQTDIDQIRMKRVTEAAEVPAAKLIGQERSVMLSKFGRRLETSYEALRRMPIDLVAFHIQRMAIQAEADKVTTVLGVIVNGDGNANTAATSYNLTALDPATTANNLTLTAWLSFKMKFPSPYMLTTALAQEGPALKLQMLNVGNANVQLFQMPWFGGANAFRPINPTLADGVALGWTGDAPAGKIVGFDRRFVIERVFEIGSNIQEVGQWIEKQVKFLVMTETEGYAVLDAGGSKVLDLTA